MQEDTVRQNLYQWVAARRDIVRVGYRGQRTKGQGGGQRQTSDKVSGIAYHMAIVSVNKRLDGGGLPGDNGCESVRERTFVPLVPLNCTYGFWVMEDLKPIALAQHIASISDFLQQCKRHNRFRVV